ncbi:carbohydrate-binding protein [Dactylosporangium sp. NPDC005555]|uniref:carbohydrate-binding protein n=1 Tax=Dactylosporangium sp. NPDC005555 TaxID=3154889 RepID=UPI0033AF78B3
MQGLHRLGATDRTLLWGTAALIAFTLGAVTVARSSGGSGVGGTDEARLCYNSAGVGSACLPSAPAEFEPVAVPSPTASPAPPAAPPASSPAAAPPPPPSRSVAVVKPPVTTGPPAPKKTGPAAWAAGVAYGAGVQVTYQGRVYACVQPHTSQSDWSPVSAPALWGRVS